MLEGAGFSRSNPYYIVKQGKVCVNTNREKNFVEICCLDYSNGYCTGCESTSVIT